MFLSSSLCAKSGLFVSKGRPVQLCILKASRLSAQGIKASRVTCTSLRALSALLDTFGPQKSGPKLTFLTGTSCSFSEMASARSRWRR